MVRRRRCGRSSVSRVLRSSLEAPHSRGAFSLADISRENRSHLLLDLEPIRLRRLFWCVRRNPIPPGIIAGAVAASATAGALVAMGRRLGSSGLAFSAIASVVTGAQFVRVSLMSVVVGAMLHVFISMAWGIAFAMLTERWRGRSVLAALAVAVVAFVISSLLARVAGRGLAVILPIGDRLILYVVFAVALILGMRFAFPARATI